ncbi:MAG: YgiQ family radical SAM protein [Acidobacteriota bacterium]
MSQFDIIFVLPYLFSDHPSFPEGLLKRSLEKEGFKVGVIEKPFWQKPESFTIHGKPKLFFAIIPGPVDSTVLNYTASRKRRIEDQYQEKGAGFFPDYPPSIKYRIRPDNTVILFANRIREKFKDTKIVIGGVESTLRQFAHYDFQKDKIRRSILFDSRANLLIHGPGEKQLVNIARSMREGSDISEIKINGTSRIEKDVSSLTNSITLPSYEDILNNKQNLLKAYLLKDKGIKSRKIICQKHGDRFVVSYPVEHYNTEDMDSVYSLPYSREHLKPGKYSPALRMNLFSVTSHRGCGGGCSFCSISQNEGKQIISRSKESILREISGLVKHREWKGVVSNVGGPSAEMYRFGCSKKTCLKDSCIFPKKCPSLKTGSDYLELLREAEKIKGVKNIFVGSGIRFDNLTEDEELLEKILRSHSGKFLRIAPEHTEDFILTLMKKPGFFELEKFMEVFNRINKSLKRKIKAAPYLIIGHPGEEKKDVEEMRRKIRSLDLDSTDAQIFTPTPGTLSTAMYYSGRSPDGQEIHVEKDIKELVRRKNRIVVRG